jgi:plastocyanin
MRPVALACVCAVAWLRASAADVAFKLVDTAGAPVADAVISLVPLDAPAKISPAPEPLEIAQNGQEFSTFVTALVVGTTVNFPNEDNVSHQVYSLSLAKKFAFPLYKPGTRGTVTFDRPGVVALGCNIHDWMLAYIVVLETPLFVKSARDGTATIPAVAPGRYRIEVWHPRLAKNETREISLASTDATRREENFTLTLKPDRRIRRSPEAAGGGYR